MTTQTCPECNTKFRSADRASPTANEGSVNQIIYCSMACKRRANNRRHYQRHRDEVIERNIENQKQK